MDYHDDGEEQDFDFDDDAPPKRWTKSLGRDAICPETRLDMLDAVDDPFDTRKER